LRAYLSWLVKFILEDVGVRWVVVLLLDPSHSIGDVVAQYLAGGHDSVQLR